MEFKDIAAITGRTGLFQIIKPTRSGVILESIDASQQKMIINSNSKVSILKDISIYTTSAENNVPLQKVMQNVHKTFNGNIEVSSKSTDTELRAFMKKAMPDYDADRVYVSDIRKLATWYSILAINAPEVFEIKEAEKEEILSPKVDSKKEEPKQEEIKPEKPKTASKAKASADAKEEKTKPAANPKAAKA